MSTNNSFAQQLRICIPPLLDALGWQGGPQLISNVLPINHEELTLGRTITAMANLGFAMEESLYPFAKITEQELPCIWISEKREVHVLLEKNGDDFFSFSGKNGTFDKFTKKEEGNFFFFTKISESDKDIGNPQREWFTSFSNRFKKQIAASLTLSFFITLTALIAPIIVIALYQQINNANSIDGFWILGLGIIAFLSVDLFFRIRRNQILSQLSARLEFLISTQVFRRILLLRPAFTESASIGSQIIRMRDFNNIKSFIESPGMISMLELPFWIILFSGLLFLSGNIALIPLGAAFTLIIFSFFIAPIVKKRTREAALSGSKKQEFLLDFFSELRFIKTSGFKQKWLKDFEKISANSAINNLHTANLNSTINHITQATVSLAGALTIGIGVFKVLDGTLNAAILIAVMMLVWKILSPITSAFSVYSQSVRIKKSINQLNRFMELPLEELTPTTNTTPLQGDILLQEVSLRYKADYRPALLNISCKIKAGEVILIKGHEGSGKSSFFKLLTGLYRAQSGKITINDINIHQLPPSILRRSFSYLPEEDTLFSTTIRNNIRYYATDATEEKINKLLDQFDLRNEIENLPNRLESTINEARDLCQNYTSFKRRVCLVRTFAHDAKFILLDDPTRGLSNKHIDILLNYLAKLKSEKTIIIISNNPVFKEKANKTYSFSMGSIIDIQTQ